MVKTIDFFSQGENDMRDKTLCFYKELDNNYSSLSFSTKNDIISYEVLKNDNQGILLFLGI